MRQFRRGCFYQNKEPKYIWKVYDIDTKLNGGTTGSISIRSNRTKMASTEFTYSNGTFTLTNPTSKTITNLNVGDYIVDIRTTTAGANITSGSAIYKVTGKSGHSNITLSYTKYTSMKNIQGSTYYYDVASDTLDYPIDGEQDGYWYVMVKGEYEMYVWDVYEKGESQNYVLGPITSTESYNPSGSPVYYRCWSSVTINTDTGSINATGSYSDKLCDSGTLSGYYCYIDGGGAAVNGKWVLGVNREGDLYKFTSSSSTNLTYGKVTSVKEVTPIKGNATGTTVESQSNTAYPENNYKGDYWYVYSHSYIYKFDNR